MFLKNTYYALIHKKRKKKASFGFFGHIQGQFRPFSACFGRIGRRPIRPDMADTARFWPNQSGSTRIEADSARIRGKKNADAVRHAGNRIGRGCGTFGAASVLSRVEPQPSDS